MRNFCLQVVLKILNKFPNKSLAKFQRKENKSDLITNSYRDNTVPERG